MTRPERSRIERTLRSYKAIPTNERLSASSGVGLLVEIFHKSPLFSEMPNHLPERLSHRSLGSGPLALTLIAGHLLGVERAYRDGALNPLKPKEIFQVAPAIF
jgi:hypothetical protein